MFSLMPFLGTVPVLFPGFNIKTIGALALPVGCQEGLAKRVSPALDVNEP
jgi:hypothetical protein